MVKGETRVGGKGIESGDSTTVTKHLGPQPDNKTSYVSRRVRFGSVEVGGDEARRRCPETRPPGAGDDAGSFCGAA